MTPVSTERVEKLIFALEGQPYANALQIGWTTADMLLLLRELLSLRASPTDGELVERLVSGNLDKVTAVDRLRLFATDSKTFDFDQDDAEVVAALLSDAIDRLSTQGKRLAELEGERNHYFREYEKRSTAWRSLN